MPVKYGKDKKGSWVKWGSRGKKYHYKKSSKASLKRALKRVDKQRRAIKWSQGRRQ